MVIIFSIDERLPLKETIIQCVGDSILAPGVNELFPASGIFVEILLKLARTVGQHIPAKVVVFAVIGSGIVNAHMIVVHELHKKLRYFRLSGGESRLWR